MASKESRATGTTRPEYKHPVFGSLRKNAKGYLRINAGPKRDQYLHRAVWELTAGKPIPEGFEVHHMNGKKCWCPHELVALEAALHPPPEPLRCPYTGRYMTREQFLRMFGYLPERAA